MRVLGLMVSTLKAVPFSQFHVGSLQREILVKWDKCPKSLDNQIWLSRETRGSLILALQQGKSFLPLYWTVVTMDASLSGWEGVLGLRSAQDCWDAGGIQTTNQCLGTSGNQVVSGSLDGSAPGAPGTDPV